MAEGFVREGLDEVGDVLVRVFPARHFCSIRRRMHNFVLSNPPGLPGLILLFGVVSVPFPASIHLALGLLFMPETGSAPEQGE
jgi:hypothetical protein